MIRHPQHTPPSDRPSAPSDANRALKEAFRLLSYRARSVEDMRLRLLRSFGDVTVEHTIVRLVEAGLLNDEKFARSWRESRERRSPRGRGYIGRELRNQGINEEVIEGALEGFDTDDAAWRAASKYAARQAEADQAVFVRRVSAFLARRGFEPDVIRRTVRHLGDEFGVGDPQADC